MATSGCLIAIEGIDGAGKGTQVDLLVEALRTQGHPVIATREPTDGVHGQRIRAQSVAGKPLSPEEQLEAFMLDRAEHVRDLIQPGLEAGAVVVTDRYFLSTAAYQGAAGLDSREILERNTALFPVPDLAVLIEISAVEALRRVTARGEERNLSFEREDFLLRALSAYAAMSLPYLDRVSGENDVASVHAEIMQRVGQALSRCGF